MKTRIANKQLKNSYPVIINCGYCNFQFLKSELFEIGFNSGIYGWNWSAYELTPDIALIDSYRNAPSQGLSRRQLEAAVAAIDEANSAARNADSAKRAEIVADLTAKINAL